MEYAGVTVENWGLFGAGLFLGSFLTLATSSFSGLFSPCVQQWAFVVHSMYFFYAFMVLFIDGAFASQEHLGMMVLYFIQFGIALRLGGCKAQDEHGFDESGGFSTEVKFD